MGRKKKIKKTKKTSKIIKAKKREKIATNKSAPQNAYKSNTFNLTK